jgi:hypothetical protein
MANGKKGGPKGNLQETHPISATVPISLYNYIEWLARHSMWGPTVQSVVEKILTRELHAMFDAGFHNKRLPETMTPPPVDKPPTA